MGLESYDFFGRIESFLETFGAGGASILLIFLALAIGIALWRGTGFVLFLLMLSFALGPIQASGVIFAATLLRWFCLGLLLVACVRRFRLPNGTMCLYLLYAILGLIFIVRSPEPAWSFQQGILKLLVAVSVPIAVTTYVSSTNDIVRLLKMVIFAAAVWTISSLIFFQSYAQSGYLRFRLGGEVGAGAGAIDAGAYLAPIVVWGIVQSRRRGLRISSSVLIIPFVLLFLLAGKRTALAGLLAIGGAPLIFLRKNPLKLIGFSIIGGLFAASSVLLMFQLLPGKAQGLTERLLSTDLTGREGLWETGLYSCFQSPLLGHGEGSASMVADQTFHNGYLIAWYNTGLLGLCALVSFLTIYTIKAWSLFRRAQTDEMADFGRLAFGYLLAVITVAFFVGSIGGVANITNCMLLIMCAIIDRLACISAGQAETNR